MRNAFTLVMAMLVLTCSPAPEPEQRNQGDELIILAGSENETLEPIVADFAAARGARIEMRYLGSVDIGLALEAGTAIEADAVWPANSLWLALGDRQRVLRHAESIMRSPVIFGVRMSVAEKLGWIGRHDVQIAEILEAVERRSLRFAMTSATQSNSGHLPTSASSTPSPAARRWSPPSTLRTPPCAPKSAGCLRGSSARRGVPGGSRISTSKWATSSTPWSTTSR
jgi:hypothetical protein